MSEKKKEKAYAPTLRISDPRTGIVIYPKMYPVDNGIKKVGNVYYPFEDGEWEVSDDMKKLIKEINEYNEKNDPQTR